MLQTPRLQVPRPLRRLLRPLVEIILPWILLPPSTASDTMLWAASAPAAQVLSRLLFQLLVHHAMPLGLSSPQLSCMSETQCLVPVHPSAPVEVHGRLPCRWQVGL